MEQVYECWWRTLHRNSQRDRPDLNSDHTETVIDRVLSILILIFPI
jgi:hypothetical protein